MAHAGHELSGYIRLLSPAGGPFLGVGLIELVAELHGKVAEAEYGEHGLEPALEGVDLASQIPQGIDHHPVSSVLLFFIGYGLIYLLAGQDGVEGLAHLTEV